MDLLLPFSAKKSCEGQVLFGIDLTVDRRIPESVASGGMSLASTMVSISDEATAFVDDNCFFKISHNSFLAVLSGD